MIISLSEAASRLVGITLAVMRLYGNFVAVSGGCAAVIGDGLFSFKNIFVAAVVVDDVEGLLQEVVDVVDNYEVSRLVGEYVASYEGFGDGSEHFFAAIVFVFAEFDAVARCGIYYILHHLVAYLIAIVEIGESGVLAEDKVAVFVDIVDAVLRHDAFGD